MRFRQGEGKPSFLLYNKEETEKNPNKRKANKMRKTRHTMTARDARREKRRMTGGHSHGQKQ